MDNHYRDDIVESYETQEGEHLLITANTGQTVYNLNGEPEEGVTYDLEHKERLNGATETLAEDMQHVEDAQQVIVGIMDNLGRQDEIQELLT